MTYLFKIDPLLMRTFAAIFSPENLRLFATHLNLDVIFADLYLQIKGNLGTKEKLDVYNTNKILIYILIF